MHFTPRWKDNVGVITKKDFQNLAANWISAAPPDAQPRPSNIESEDEGPAQSAETQENVVENDA